MILSVSSRAFVDACGRLGLDVPALLADAGIDEATVRDPDGRLPVSAVRRLWTLAHARSGDPDLALHAAEALPFGAYRALDFLVANAPDLGAGLSALARYFRLVNPGVQLELSVQGDGARFGFRQRPTGAVARPYAEYTLCACLLRTRIATGVEFPLRAVHFAHAAPPSVAEHRRVFGCPVRFGERTSEWLMERAWLDTPVAGAHPELFTVLEHHARRLAGRASESPLLVRLRACLGGLLDAGAASLDGAASALAMSPRTLQRGLAAHGVSYREVLDALRRDRAIEALEQAEMSIGEIGFLLGFGTQAAFCRAFRRWTGRSPRQCRRRARRAQGVDRTP